MTQKAKNIALTVYFPMEPTLKLTIAKFLETRTSDFIELSQWNQCFPLELCWRWHAQPSSNAITSCVGNTRLSRLELVFCRPLLSKSPLVSTSFANLTVDQILKGILKWIPAN